MKKDLVKTLGKALKEFREAKGMSQQELGDYSETDRAFISKIERGLSVPTISTIFKLCESLEIKPSEFLSRVEQLMK